MSRQTSSLRHDIATPESIIDQRVVWHVVSRSDASSLRVGVRKQYCKPSGSADVKLFGTPGDVASDIWHVLTASSDGIGVREMWG